MLCPLGVVSSLKYKIENRELFKNSLRLDLDDSLQILSV
ncbi:protein of unknown function [Candidatus Nitrosotalea okcheonensis]|uniref:Uncharacterized protein n=1 Tax=Candidatus Nitrosotalea okcheonensis TaxID=1903276 RepID=A0A2H1FCS8_9ARCH|nr:protein of unknown function [Candidatus Nitrosotalea okcheonensis]